MQSTPESGGRGGYDGDKRRKGSKVRIAVDTLGHLQAVKVTAANEQERAQVGALVKALQETAGNKVELAFVDQGYTGEEPAAQAAQHGVRLEVVELEEAKRGFCAAAQTLGGGALLCLGRPLPPPRPRLRKTARIARRSSLAGLRLSYA